MANLQEVLEMEQLGIRVEILRTGAETGGELFEMDVIGRPAGFFKQRHVHTTQVERIEVVSGAMKVAIDGEEHVLGEGQSIEIPPGTPHTQVPLGDGPGRIRIQVRPADRTEAFLRDLARLCRGGKVTRSGFPKPLAAAELILEHAEAGHASSPPLRVQRAIANLILGVARPYRPYVFVDEWDVAAPARAVFEALADANSYPVWWRPVYLDVECDGPPVVGAESRQHFKGRLPYHLRTRSVITALDTPRSISADVEGDLRGRGTWTLTPTATGTHVRFDWQVHADRRLLRILTPVLRPALRWNHNWAIARAMEGLEPYAQRQAERLLTAV
ncbi:MAG TPA: SRPBCC family protein [Solirubrobacteraceae bacterium]|nr:SRPBCC family protein [Solirubrobacteraceae bacterium]